MSLFPETSGAIFSPCRQYRYQLWRRWDDSKDMLMFLMLNPSTADENDNDPTVERCQRRAVQMGYGGLRVANLFAIRSPYPEVLYKTEDPVGPDNDQAIIESAKESGMVICAWGTDGDYLDRGKKVLELLKTNGIQPYYLQLNQDGSPKHPLYVAYDIQPQPLAL